MLCFHHVNLGVAPDGVTAEAEFLTAVLGYRKLETPTGSTAGVSAIKFEGDDGAQIHLDRLRLPSVAQRAHRR
jgi:hypothetical protein